MTRPPGKRLNDRHTDMLLASAISQEVIDSRGYWSEVKRSDLAELGFGSRASRPGLVLPIWDVYGEMSGFQLRPDTPRELRGKQAKYEFPKGDTSKLDVHPSSQPYLADPSRELWITEGIKKGDSLTSAGVCAIALGGVWNWRGRNDFAGKSALPDWESVALNGRRVFIVFDSDVLSKQSVRLALLRLSRLLESRGATVQVVQLPAPADGSKIGVDDYLAMGNGLLALRRLVVDRITVVDRKEDRPGIVVGSSQLREQTREAIELLLGSNEPPVIFCRGGQLVRIRQLESGRYVIETLNFTSLRNRLAEVGDWYRERQDDVVSVSPPKDIVENVLASPDLPFPPLNGVISAPALRPDGTVLCEPGYDRSTSLLHIRSEVISENLLVPEHPTAEQSGAARGVLEDLLVDFPFTDQASKANAFALLLSPVLRPAIAGNVCLAIIDAPQQGSGKGLLADVVGTLATGEALPAMVAPNSRAEWRKQIMANLIAGHSLVKIDNVDRELSAAEFSAMLTSTRWEGRELGRSTNLSLRQRAIWIATGNNVRIGGDIGRRSYLIRLDPKTARPWERRNFRHSDLLGHARANRQALVVAALTLCRAWWSAGRPYSNSPVVGGFEEWSRTIGGILEHAGVEGFLANRGDLYANADEESAEWSRWFDIWAKRFEHPVTVSELFQVLQDTTDELTTAMPMAISHALDRGTSHGASAAIGKALGSRENRRYRDDGLRVESGYNRTRTGAKMWRVVIDSDTP